MGKLDRAQDRAMELIGEIGDGLRKRVPDKAVQWVETGAALGALRASSKVAGSFVRRNPYLVGAVVAGAGLLWLAARHQSRKRQVQEASLLRQQAVRRGDFEQDDYGV
ncbi:hypothetical protein [Thermomonas sp.]|uniref:hypothetical protein n=1 Tax=Thermomonas sp. TaxID=1971895 RepID=UPI00260F25BA|nr:hypothetical protein [Thermomonas sp.]MCO5055392.1 hypothetical protein [Thermomonas sp.]HRO63266.1 hypothetical protein [Thermomonas sp.]